MDNQQNDNSSWIDGQPGERLAHPTDEPEPGTAKHCICSALQGDPISIFALYTRLSSDLDLKDCFDSDFDKGDLVQGGHEQQSDIGTGNRTSQESQTETQTESETF